MKRINDLAHIQALYPVSDDIFMRQQKHRTSKMGAALRARCFLYTYFTITQKKFIEIIFVSTFYY